jgi:26S proteasome regulatory subunit N1
VLPLVDINATLHKKWHFLLYNFAVAMNPRFMTTVNAAGEHVPVEVRVGQAVETVGQAGRPKTITGFQTHTTPVLLGVKDRAELADDAYLPMTNVCEWVVVLKPNPLASKKPAAKKAAPGSGGAASGSAGAAGGRH